MAQVIPREVLEQLGRFCNEINGSLAAGLAGQGDSGLKESERLPLAPPHLILGSVNEQTATSPWTVIGTHVEQSRALMSLAHAALIAKREGLVGRKWDSLSRDDQVKGIKVAVAFTAVHSGLTGYFEPDPNELVIQRDATVAYKGRQAVPVPPGYTSEEDTSDPLYPLPRRGASYYGVDLPAQDSRDMIQAEMEESIQIAIDSQKGSGWLLSYCTSELVGKALTLMVATKFNWYQTNHHVGQNHATSFIVKIAANTCPFMQNSEHSISESAKSAIWEIGHWVSTHLCMNLMAMRTRKRISAHPSGSPIGTANLADDMKIRWDSAPAGMAPAALLYSAMKLHHKNMLWLVAPDVDQVLDCASAYQQFLNDVSLAKATKSVDPRMRNHEGRMYLTGRGDKHRIMDLTVPLGVVGSFLFHKCPNSTMTASPLISVRNRNNRMEAKYQNHHGYSAEFDELCRVTKDKVLEVTKEVKDLIGVSDTALSISKTDYVTLMQVFDVDPAESASKFNHAANSLGAGHGRFAPGRKRRREDSSPDWRDTRRQHTESPALPPSDTEDDPLGREPEMGEDGGPFDDPGAGPSSGQA